MFKAKVYITLKKGVLDPQGVAVQNALHALGHREVTDVRVGKYMEVFLTAADKTEAEQLINDMATRLLANPVIEDFEFTITEV